MTSLFEQSEDLKADGGVKLHRFKVLFVTNYPSPYRVDFFNLLGSKVNLTVVFTEKPETQHHRSAKWFNTDYSGFRAVFLKKTIHIGSKTVFTDIFPMLSDGYDFIILGGYTSGTQIAAIKYMRLRGIPFAIEADGGLISKNESKLKASLKKHLIGAASAWLSSGEITKEYFIHYGAKPNRVFYYPFSSQKNEDIENAKICRQKNRSAVKEELNIREPLLVITVGQMIYRKGIDVLLHAANNLPDDIAVLIIGGDVPPEYIEIKERLDLKHVYFEGFKVKEELSKYYLAADLFVMPTREDIWGLVINEAMSFGLPIVTTDRCVAGMELVENGKNGVIVPVENPEALAKGIMFVLNADRSSMGQYSLQKIKGYTIENMVDAHMIFFEKMSDRLR